MFRLLDLILLVKMMMMVEAVPGVCPVCTGHPRTPTTRRSTTVRAGWCCGMMGQGRVSWTVWRCTSSPGPPTPSPCSEECWVLGTSSGSSPGEWSTTPGVSPSTSTRSSLCSFLSHLLNYLLDTIYKCLYLSIDFCELIDFSCVGDETPSLSSYLKIFLTTATTACPTLVSVNISLVSLFPDNLTMLRRRCLVTIMNILVPCHDINSEIVCQSKSIC